VGLDGDLIANKHVFSFARRLTTWHCSHSLPNTVLLRRRCRWEPGADAAAVDQYILHAAGPTAANLPQRRASVE